MSICKCGGEPVQNQGKCLQIGFPLSVIVGIALIVIGSLAAAGVFYPTNPILSPLGHAFGAIGSLSTTGGGILVIAIAAVWRCCSGSSKTESTGVEPYRQRSTGEQGLPNPTGGHTGGDGENTAMGSQLNPHWGNMLESDDGDDI